MAMDISVFKTYFMGLRPSERVRFARDCGTSRQHLTNIAYGGKKCSPMLAIAIDRESRGLVPCESLCADADFSYLRGTRRKAA